MRLYKKDKYNRYICYTLKLEGDYNINDICDFFQTNRVFIKADKYFEVKSISENTPWTSNVLKICKNSNMNYIKNVERSYIYLIQSEEEKEVIFNKYHDRMTETYNKVFKQSYYEEEVDYNFDYLNKKYGITFDDTEKEYIKNNILNWNDPLFVLLDLAQSNSEHCRHHFFNGNLILNNKKLNHTLFNLVKKPLLNKSNSNSLVAFSDNSSVIKGFDSYFIDQINNTYKLKSQNIDFVLTAETHNFPTGIAPFQGAATGIGGRIRDVQATGIGAIPICSSAGYCVGSLNSKLSYPPNMASPLQILIEASNGASDYGNKFGEPIILGFTRSFQNTERERIEWIKPIMFTGGLGLIKRQHIHKKEIKKGMYVCKIGGPAYKVGIGGGSASSRIADNKNYELDYSAVQRDDAEMAQKMNRVIKSCIHLGDKNPIISIHDQGAGGNGNVIKEIIEDKGAIIDLGHIKLGDSSMNDIEIWISEYQESNAIITDNLELLDLICKRENVNLDLLGIITGDGKLTIKNEKRIIIENYPINTKCNKKTYQLKDTKIKLNKFVSKNKLPAYIAKVLQMPTVGSKRFLTNKVDRSVSGLIVQQQCVGPLHTPLSNYGLYCHSFLNSTGCATSIGEQPIFGLIDPISMVHKTVAEMLTNLMFVVIDDFENISCSANWMWPCPNKYPEEGFKMYLAMKTLSDIFCELGLIIDGGKDSLSMAVKHNKLVKCPGSLVLSSYAKCPDIYNRVTPEFKKIGSYIYYIDLSDGNMNMGGSALSRVINNIYTKPPYIRNLNKLKDTFKYVQKLITERRILAGHDKSDGGLITTLIEMSIASNIGFDININTKDIIKYLFNEEIGVVIESKYELQGYNIIKLGQTIEDNRIIIKNKNKLIYNEMVTTLRMYWEKPSFEIEKLQCNIHCAVQENILYQSFKIPEYNILPKHLLTKNLKYKRIGIIREEGSNSDNEIGSAFLLNGHHVFDIHTQDLINGRTLDDLDVIVFVGGFSYGDTLGAAQGWYSVIKNNKHVNNEFIKFYNRKETKSLGVCNGCQLMVKLGWLGEGISLHKNLSGRFESRFSSVKVNESKCVFTKGLDDLVMGIWVAHGEGRFVIDNYQKLKKNKQIVMQYVDYNKKVTLNYPQNPNSSDHGIAGLCSPDGRHFALMPHPERSFLKRQIPWKYELFKDYTPWFRIFQ